eukprot:gene10848-biopygen7247
MPRRDPHGAPQRGRRLEGPVPRQARLRDSFLAHGARGGAPRGAARPPFRRDALHRREPRALRLVGLHVLHRQGLGTPSRPAIPGGESGGLRVPFIRPDRCGEHCPSIGCPPLLRSETPCERCLAEDPLQAHADQPGTSHRTGSVDPEYATPHLRCIGHLALLARHDGAAPTSGGNARLRQHVVHGVSSARGELGQTARPPSGATERRREQSGCQGLFPTLAMPAGRAATRPRRRHGGKGPGRAASAGSALIPSAKS